MTSAFYEIDLAFISFCLFVAFFVGLIFYLRREDRREGYPMVGETSGKPQLAGANIFVPEPKSFRLPHGQGVATSPGKLKDGRDDIAVKRTGVAPGSPLEPVGDPMQAGVGPGAWTRRADKPDLLHNGEPKIVPLRRANDFFIVPGDTDPRGLKVCGIDRRVVAGTVADVWVDRGEHLIRYLEVRLEGGAAKTVLLPMAMATLSGWRPRVLVDAVQSAQFAGVPQLANPEQITLNEEERICAYYGGGYLYATKDRAEPVL